LDEQGVPRRDPSAHAIALVQEHSREFGVTIDDVDGRWIVTAATSAGIANDQD
jgi:hypothetical protein